MAKSGAFEVTEVLRLLLRSIRLSLHDRRSIDHRERHSEHRQRRRLGRERFRLEGTGEHVDRETRAFYWVYRFVFFIGKFVKDVELLRQNRSNVEFFQNN